MQEIKKNKFYYVICIVVFLAILIMSIGNIYGYLYRKRVINNSNIIIKNVNIVNEFNLNDEINVDSVVAGYSDSITFKIENVSDELIGNYKVYLNIIEPLSNNIDSSFKYSLSGVSDNDKGNVISVSNEIVPIERVLIGKSFIYPKEKHIYNFSIILDKNSKYNYIDKKFICKIEVESSVD